MELINKPVPPRKPEPHECCGTGCIPCVMDLYEEELWEYEKSIKLWNENHHKPLPPITDGPT
jgi:hypothetical protein